MMLGNSYFASEKAKAKKELESGKFGNTLRTWETPADFLKTDLQECGIRILEPGSKYFTGKIPRSELQDAWDRIPAEIPRYISESPMDDLRYANLEVTKPDGPPWVYYMRYNHIDPGSLRTAMSDPDTGRFWEATGPAALALLQMWCWPRSYVMIYDLLQDYPGHVFEISVFKYELGTIPGHNTVIWEARKTY